MSEIVRAQSRMPFGIEQPRRAVLGTLLVGAAMCAAGALFAGPVVLILGICVVMVVPMLLLSFASARAQRVVLVVQDDGLVIERRGARDLIRFADITGIIDLRLQGRAANLGIETRSGRRDVSTMAIPTDDVSRVVAALRARL